MILAMLFTFGISANAQSANDIFMSNFTGANSYVAPVKKKKKKAPVTVATPEPSVQMPEVIVNAQAPAAAPAPAPTSITHDDGFRETPAVSQADKEQQEIDEAWDTRMKYWSQEAMKLGGPKEEDQPVTVAAATAPATDAYKAPTIINAPKPERETSSVTDTPAAKTSEATPEEKPVQVAAAETSPSPDEVKAKAIDAEKKKQAAASQSDCKKAVESRGAAKCIKDFAGYKCIEKSLVSSLQGIGSIGSDGREKSFMVGSSIQKTVVVVNVDIQNAFEIKKTGEAPEEKMSLIYKTWNSHDGQIEGGDDDVGIKRACFTPTESGFTKADIEMDKIDSKTGRSARVSVTIARKQMSLQHEQAGEIRMNIYTPDERNLFEKRFEQVGVARNGESTWNRGER